MELIRAASYGVAYFMAFAALGAVLDGRRRAGVPLVVDTGLIAVLVWVFARPDAARVALAVTLALVCLVVTGLIVWDVTPAPPVRVRGVRSAVAVAPTLPPRRAAGPGQPPWHARTAPNTPAPPPPPTGQIDWVRPVPPPPRRAVAWAERSGVGPMLSEPYRSDQ